MSEFENATPRPWTIRASSDASGDVGITADVFNNVLAETFADLRFQGERNTAEARANAELIVRAVNAFEPLVAALEDARKAISNAIEVVGSRKGDPEFTTLAKVEAALAKARGEQ
jgi:hypothetical protein